MSNDYKADPLSNKEIDDFIEALKKSLGISLDDIPNILEVLQRRQIFTRYGMKTLSVTIVPDGSLGDDEARTFSTPGHVKIEVERTIWDRATNDHPRSLMTLRHELGHAVLHEKPVALARSADSLKVTRAAYIQPYESAEHQANYFASAFQMSRQVVLRFSSPGKLAAACKVSLPAATIRFDQCISKRREIPEKTKSIISEILSKASRPAPVRGISREALLLWERLPVIPDEDPTEFRQTKSGFGIKKDEFNKVSARGWFVENGEIHASLERHNCS